MAIDIRATVTCSLGTLISGSLSDDYLQGSGLVKTRGTCEISGLITPAVGTAVTFSYTKGGVTRSIPRKLRVLSSFADPFRRTTKIELGCKLTYMSDLQDSIKWTAFDDNENNDYDEDDQRIVTLPIRASSIMTKCLTEIGISASSSPLTNKFSIAEFDFGAGYVQVLSDLLVSESYFGYLDTNEVLQIASLDQEGGTGPVYTSADIVDLGPIGTGQLPGEAVTVSYSTLKLKQPEVSSTPSDQDEEIIVQRLNWERDESISSPQTYYINYKINGSGPMLTLSYSGGSSTVTTTTYIPLTVYDEATKSTSTSDVVSKRETITTGPSISVASSIAQQYLENGISFGAGQIVTSKTVETYEYFNGGATVIQRTTKSTTGAEHVAGLSIPLVFDDGVVNPSYTLRDSEYIETKNTKEGSLSKQEVSTYTLYGFTQPGQQQVALLSQYIDTYAEAELAIDYALEGGLVHKDTTVQTQTSGSTVSVLQRRPIVTFKYIDGGDPNNGWRTESKADLELALGSATAQRRIEFSMPYAPDDIFSGPSGGPFTATPSDAPAKANRYGRVQNRLLLGNRSGVNLQLAPERLPVAPFSPLYLQADGLTALYRANGNQWAFDSNGIVCSTDALFWAAVGGTGTFWFPVAPGITTLPAEPAIVDGQMNATNVVLPYNETAIYEGRLRLGNAVTKFEYALELLTVVPALSLKTEVEVRRILKVEVPAATTLALAAPVPQISTGAIVKPPAAGTSIAVLLPTVASGASASIPIVDFAFSALVPFSVGRISTQVAVPAGNLNVAALAPAVSSGTSVQLPVADVATAGLVPSSISIVDPNFADVTLLLHMDGSNASTTFTDSSGTPKTVTAVGNAQLDTSQAKFGSASGKFDGSGDGLTVPYSTAWSFGTGNFTVEGWVRPRIAVTTRMNLVSIFNATNKGWGVAILDTGKLRAFIEGTSSVLIGPGSTTVTDSAWHHFALVRDGNTFAIYLDGVQEATATTSQSVGSGSSSNLELGAEVGAATRYLDGWLDEVRITKGVARYTAAFTPTTVPFPNQ